jgi:tetratricopeptide (TPR) repeat protein
MNRQQRRRQKADARRAGSAQPQPAPSGLGAAQELFARAVADHRAGRLDAAKRLYEQVLAAVPGHTDALHALGLLHQQCGRGAEAVALLQRAAASRPGSAHILNDLGGVHLALGERDAAAERFAEAVAIEPRFAVAHYNLGLTRMRQGDPERAVGCFEAAVNLAPDNVTAQLMLGNALDDAGRGADAIAQYRTLARIAPALPQVWYNLGLSLKAKGELEEAAQAFRQAIACDPRLAAAHNNLATTLAKLGRIAEAAQCFERALALDPDLVEAHVGFASALQEGGNLERAARHLRRALALKPDTVAYLAQLGSCLSQLGDTEEAMVHLRRALDLDPGSAEVHGALGMALAFQGRFEDSTAEYDKALSIRPVFPEVLYGRVRNSKAHRTESEAARLQAFLSDATISVTDKAELHFALGQIYEDLGDYARSFEHYRQGNEMIHARLPFDREAWRSDIDALMRTFAGEFFAQRRWLGSDSRLPIFICGRPRSGTTLVEQILSAHPGVAGGGELMHFAQMAETLQESFGLSAPYPKGAAELGSAQAAEMIRYYLGRLTREHPDSARVTDKLPGNFLRLGLIALLFPNAGFIHCRRNPVDTCLSCYFLKFQQAHPYSYRLEDLGFYYREYERLMAHWRRALPVPMLEVDYEDLVARQEKVSRRLVAHCGLDWDDRCLDFHESDRNVRTASLAQVRQPMYGTSVERWRRFEPFLGPLRAALQGIESGTGA